MSTNENIGSIGGELKSLLKRRSARTAARKNRSDDETGALLILALVFLVVISVLCASLSLWATNNLNNTSKFASALSLQSASNSATQLAVQDVRYNFTDSQADPPNVPADLTLNASPPQPCWMPQSPLAPVAQVPFGVENIAVWCSTQWNPLSPNTRVVTFSTCPESAFANGTPSAVIDLAATACALNPFLQAVVQFDDNPTNISAANCSPLGNATCGTTFTILSWAFGVLVPNVATATATASSTTLCSSTREIDITGANLAANNVVFPTGAILTGGTNTSLTTCASSQMVTNDAYSVSVTTPSGTSAAFPIDFSAGA
jgi:hypothetical protein